MVATLRPNTPSLPEVAQVTKAKQVQANFAVNGGGSNGVRDGSWPLATDGWEGLRLNFSTPPFIATAAVLQTIKLVAEFTSVEPADGSAGTSSAADPSQPYAIRPAQTLCN